MERDEEGERDTERDTERRLRFRKREREFPKRERECVGEREKGNKSSPPPSFFSANTLHELNRLCPCMFQN